MSLEYSMVPGDELNAFFTEYYKLFVNRFTYYCGPIVIQRGDERTVVLSTHDTLDVNFQEFTRRKLTEFGITSQDVHGRKNIVTFYNRLIAEVIRELVTEIRAFNPIRVFEIVYCIAGYMAEFHTRINMVLYGDFPLEQLTINDDERLLLETIINCPPESRYNIEIIKGTDKMIAQYLTPLILGSSDNITRVTEEFTSVAFVKLFSLTGIAVKLIADREIATGVLPNEMGVKIRDGTIERFTTYEFYFKFVQEVTTMREDYDMPDDVRRELYENFTRVYGFMPTTVERLLMTLHDRNLDESVCSIIPLDLFKQLVTDLAKVSIEEAEEFLYYFSMGSSDRENSLYLSPEKLEKRLWENPLVLFGSDPDNLFVFFSVPLMADAYRILQHKLQYNLIPGCASLSSKTVETVIKNSLVEEVVHALIEHAYDPVWRNFQDANIETNAGVHRLHLLGEVDVLGAIDSTLLIIECKDLSPRFTSAGIRADTEKTRNYVTTMVQKVGDIKSNLTDLEVLLGRKVSKIVPLIVFRHPTAAESLLPAVSEVRILSFKEFKSRLPIY